ncbi:hypothetical protein B0H14DRAFT_3498462 [Mycena olivaceomarginata]|nr:hypothetical protein B0H14DRAFT_3498462 [Mycena olivaceomarginata]
MPFPPVDFVFVYTSITSPPPRSSGPGRTLYDSNRMGNEIPDLASGTLTPAQPPTAINKPSPLSTPLLHYSHQRCCSIPAHGPTLGDGEGVENFWAKVVSRTDAYIVETVGLAEDAAAEDLRSCKLLKS